jgi:flavin-dependent dehydrogenase
VAAARALTDADVIVVGGGPAGCAAATTATLLGLRSVLVERRARPGAPPGETLHPGVEPALEAFGAGWTAHAACTLRHDGILLRWPGPDTRIALYGGDERGSWHGFQVRRSAFAAALLEHATALGVKVVRPCRAVAPLVTGTRVTGVLTSAGPLTAPWVIDAAGGGHWLARRLGLAIARDSPRLVARYGYCAGARPGDDGRPAFAAVGCGWSWTAQVGPERHAWVRLGLAGDGGSPTACPPALACLAPDGTTRAADVTWRALPTPCGPGFLVAGDAASVTDPASSHGVLRALLSGVLAARVAAAVMGGHQPEPLARATYGAWTAGQHRADTTALRGLYAALIPRPAWIGAPDRTPPARARSLHRADVSEEHATPTIEESHERRRPRGARTLSDR